MTEDELIDRAVAGLGVRHTFQKEEGQAIQLSVLVRVADWRPLVAPWWRGKEVCIIAADVDGNFFLRHCDGTVRYWQHRTQDEVIVSKSVREFVQRIIV